MMSVIGENAAMRSSEDERRGSRVTVVLGGGRSTRMGTDKLGLRIDGSTLLERAVAAGLNWSDRVVIAGPRPQHWRPDSRVSFVVEDPPFGGPVAGLFAALEAVRDADEVVILAGDLAAPARVVAILAEAPMGRDGVVLEDSDGWAQYLAGRYRVAAVRQALRDVGGVRGASVRRTLSPLRLHQVPVASAISLDLDTPNDAKIVGAANI